jgi:hypothetical protein
VTSSPLRQPRLSHTETEKLKMSHCMQWRRLGEEKVYLLLILDLGIGLGWVVSVTTRGRTRDPLYRRLGGPQSRSEQRLEEKSFRLCRGSNPDRPVVQPVVRHYTAWANPGKDNEIYCSHVRRRTVVPVVHSPLMLLQNSRTERRPWNNGRSVRSAISIPAHSAHSAGNATFFPP